MESSSIPESKIPQASSDPHVSHQDRNLQVNRWLKIGLLAIALLVLLSGAYLLGKSHSVSSTEKQVSQLPTASPTPTPVKEELATYVNPLGFSVVYGTTNRFAFICKEDHTNANGTVKLKLFEDPAESRIYIGNEGEIQFKENYCTNVPNSLEYIKTGYENGQAPPFNITYPNVIEYTYKPINSDADLVALGNSAFKGLNCTKVEKTLVEGRPDVYAVRLTDNNGETVVGGGCQTNYVYDFYYSTKNKVAVVGNGRQDCAFSAEPKITKGIGSSCGAQIVFE